MRPVLWEVDAQADFILPGGKLYVPRAERIVPNLNRLVEVARQGRVLLISSADAHSPDDPELREWPPHCLKGTAGAEVIPEARAARQLVIPNQRDFVPPDDLSAYQQIVLEKNTLDVFDNPNTNALLARLNASRKTDAAGSSPNFLVFGVVTEYCVLHAADGLIRRGYRVGIVEDAIQSLDEKKGRETLDDLESRGARLITTAQALALVDRDARAAAEIKGHRATGR
jgi:nicotinamidase/pyrazinamidase